jgi:hypothetical protein
MKTRTLRTSRISSLSFELSEGDMKRPKTKMQLYRTLRKTWTLKPVTKVKQSARVYSRKKKHPKKEEY